MDKIVFATFRQAGMHHWPDAPTEHVYLRAPHRHVFHVRIEVAVGGLNRDIEFIQLKRDAAWRFVRLANVNSTHGNSDALDYGARSCEMLAADLKASMIGEYNIVAIEVSEDGENGARLAWDEN